MRRRRRRRRSRRRRKQQERQLQPQARRTVGREKIKEENPGISVTDVSKKAGELWAKLDKQAKEKFEEKAKEAKEKYEEEHRLWLENGGEGAEKESKKGKKAPTGGSGKGFKSAEFIKDGTDSDEDEEE